MSFTVEEIEKIHEAGELLMPAAKAYGRNIGNLDSVFVSDLMDEAIDKTLQYSDFQKIKDIRAYLFTVFKRQLLEWIRKKRKEAPEEQLLPSDTSFLRDIEKKILVEEIVNLMNDKERFIFDNLNLGYSYEEIAKLYDLEFKEQIAENVLRSKYSKAIKRIAKKLTD